MVVEIVTVISEYKMQLQPRRVRYGRHKLELAGLYTFGQPPVGTIRFCSKFEKQFPNRFFRFVNHTDAVSGTPILFRKHVGELRYFDTSGALWEGKPPWRVSFLDHVRAPAKFGGLSQFAAHSMNTMWSFLRSSFLKDSHIERGVNK